MRESIKEMPGKTTGIDDTGNAIPLENRERSDCMVKHWITYGDWLGTHIYTHISPLHNFVS